MTISYEKYEEELKLFVIKWNSTYSNEQWKIGTKHIGLYAELKYLNEKDNLWLHFFIIYSQSYAIPELWFNVYTPGSLQQRLPLEEAVKSPELASKCSEDEHRFLGIAFFYVDPCRILQAIQGSVKSTDSDYILKWFTVASQVTRCRSPIELISSTFSSDNLFLDQTNQEKI